VSENDDSHYVGTIKVEVTSHGKERLKRKAFKRPRKTGIQGADVMCWGRLFQLRAAAAGKAWLPTCDSCKMAVGMACTTSISTTGSYNYSSHNNAQHTKMHAMRIQNNDFPTNKTSIIRSRKTPFKVLHSDFDIRTCLLVIWVLFWSTATDALGDTINTECKWLLNVLTAENQIAPYENIANYIINTIII